MRYIDGFGYLLRDPTDDGSDSGGGGDSDPDSNVALAALKAEHGSNRKALRALWNENKKLRKQRRTLRSQVEELERKVEDVADQDVLTDDDAKALVAYRELGKPEEIKTAIQEATGLKQKVAESERKDLLASVAKEAGWGGKEAVLARVLQEGDTVELREETIEGEKVQVPWITPEGQSAVKLTEHAEKAWPEFLPSLTAESGNGGSTSTGRRLPKLSQQGKPDSIDPVAKALGDDFMTPHEAAKATKE